MQASSPLARGSSGLQPRVPGPLRVVPARAGVIPTSGALRRALSCRPRPRGGHPGSPLATYEPWVSSPPARGSSGGREQRDHQQAVVPARAGVIRTAGSSTPSTGRRPRPRGGHPCAWQEWCVATGSSPPARGSSVEGSCGSAGRLVVPARAGVIRSGQTTSRCPRCRPRPRGGHPDQHATRNLGAASSLPARGSSGRVHRRHARHVVVPARAGVIPT